MATVVKYAIRSAAGWDSMTPTEQAEYAGYFETLTAWSAIIPADISTGTGTDEHWIAECFDDWPSGLVENFVEPVVTDDATGHITMRGADGHIHSGNINSGFLITSSSKYTTTFKASNPYTKIEGMRIFATGSIKNHALNLDISSGAFGLVADRLIISSVGTADGVRAFKGPGTLKNTYIFGSGAVGINSGRYESTNIFNVVVDGYDSGLYSGGTNQAKLLHNVIFLNCTTDLDNTAINTNSSNNATDKSVAPDPSFSVLNVSDADFIDAPNNNYHLSPISQLLNQGLNLIENGTLISPQYDIDGQQWPDTGNWDIGFDWKMPRAINDTYTVTQGTQLTGNVLDNDTTMCN